MARFDDQCEGVKIRGDRLNYGMRSYNIWECHAEVDQGAQIAARVTATRVMIGTAIAPGIGTLVGALARKNRTKVYLAISTPLEPILVELNAKREGAARRFAMKVNQAAEHFAPN